MYFPKTFEEQDQGLITEWIRANPFGGLAINGEDGFPIVNYLPFYWDSVTSTLKGHIAKANPMMKKLESGLPVVITFLGQNGYVSPNYYVQKSVPTWNYTVVQCRGRLNLIDGTNAFSVMHDMTAVFERDQVNPWTLDDLDDATLEKLMTHIQCFEIVDVEMRAKAKMSQNKSDEDRKGVAKGLRQAGKEQLAKLVEFYF